MSTDKRIDSYISKSAPFAQPILRHIREIVHEVCPDADETIKWGFPHFQYHGMLCSMAAFKAHCAFGFRKAAIMKNAVFLKKNQEDAMGHLGRITSLKDLPTDKQLKAMIGEAMMLNETGMSLPSAPKKKEKKDLNPPVLLLKKFEKSKKAAANFNAFSPSHQYEYIEWINEAKTEATLSKRVEQTIEWLLEGKRRNWKYEKR